ncbi:MAG: oligosaccharide flippase family protein [Bacteroidales bacterium]|jgi:O-antigen/teichoic acid export membrane protein|nr:oligosaccharide flippase family protein [Bacteroidales bacterium]
MTKIFKNTSFYAIGNILPQAAGFILLPIYTRYLTPGDYGIVSSMQVLSTILAVFFTLAIDRSILRLYFDYKTDKDKKDYLGTITISLIVIATIILSLLFAFKGIVGDIYESIEFYPYYLYAILTAFLTIFSIIPKVYLQVEEKAGKFVLLSIVQFIFTTGLVLWFIIGEKSGAVGMLKGRLFGNIITLPIYFYLAYRIINFTFKFQVLKESLSFSLPMIPGLLSAWILNLSDRVFIERYFNLHDVGIYSLGYKIAGLVLILTSAFYLAYSPVFYRLANSKDQEVAKSTLYKYNNVYIMVILLITFLISLFSKEAIQILLDKKYFEAYKIVPIISFAYLISQASGLFNLMVYQEKKVVKLMWIGVTGAGLNIILNFLLVPNLGAYGAAYATVLSFRVVFILSFRYAKKCYYIPFNWRQIVPVFSLLFVIAAFFLFVNINIYLTLLIKVTVCFVIGILFLKKYYKQLRIIFVKS